MSGTNLNETYLDQESQKQICGYSGLYRKEVWRCRPTTIQNKDKGIYRVAKRISRNGDFGNQGEEFKGLSTYQTNKSILQIKG